MVAVGGRRSPTLGVERSAGLRLVALLVAIVPPLTQLVDLLATDRRWWPQMLEDDAFYYLGVARNLVEGHGSTFTGLVSTNGYHPLWLLVLVPLTWIARRPDQIVAVVLAVEGVLWIAMVREALRIGRRLGSEAVAVAGVAVLGVLGVATGRLSFNGMESAPLLFLLVLAVRIGIEAGDDDPRADRWFGVVLALVCLTRLDAVVAAVGLALVMLWRQPAPGEGRGRRAVRLAGPAIGALAAYLTVNALAFGSALPVSGRAKGVGGPFLNLEPVRQLLRAGDALGRPLWFGTIALAMVAGAWLCRWWRGSPDGRRLMAFTLAFVVGQLLLLAYLVVGTSYRVWPWYHYNVALLAFGAALILGNWAAQHLDVATTCRAGVVVAGLFLVGQAAGTFYDTGVSYRASFSGARFVDEDLPDDAVLAMGDRAGIFGYLADRPLLHLEGLMADAAYVDDLERGTALRRLGDEGVDYFVNYGPVGTPVTVDGRSCERFEEPRQGHGPRFTVTVCDDDLVFRDGSDDEALTIWRFRPELN